MNFKPDRRMNTPAASPCSAEIVLGDLDALLCAVKVRLRLLADGADRLAAASADDGADAHFRCGVLECVDALGQVHVMLAQEIAHRGRLEQLVVDASAVLARATPELAAGLGPTLRMGLPSVSHSPKRLQARAG